MEYKIDCPTCKGKGTVTDSFLSDFQMLSFLIPRNIYPFILDEIKRISKIAEIKTDNPALNRGLALEYICANSALTPEESLI